MHWNLTRATLKRPFAVIALSLLCLNAGNAVGQTAQGVASPATAQMPQWAVPFPLAVPGFGTVPQAGASAMDPFSRWAMTMMSPMLSASNPVMYSQMMRMMMNPMVDTMTKHQFLEGMMGGFDPQMVFGKAPIGKFGVPRTLPAISIPGFPTQARRSFVPNTVTGSISREAKRRAFQTMMMMSPMSMRDMVGIMAEKMPIAEDVSFDDAVDAMKLRANEINFKLVGHNALWLDVKAISGDENTRRVEIFHFCDAVVARKVLDIVPEFVVFLPCRIALLEDADKKLWVMTMDWDVSWMDYSQNPNNQLAEELRGDAKRIRDGIRYIMEGAATGDF
jgi:uncharacterized protein (DUF302 family)